MRHRKRTFNKLGRTTAHRESMLANLVCSLIEHRRITTTLVKAKAARPVAEKLVTLGKQAQALGEVEVERVKRDREGKEVRREKRTVAHPGALHARRLAISRLGNPEAVGVLFSTIAPAMKDRQGGYTRILKLGRRASDSSEMALLEWVDYIPPAPAAEKAEPKDEAKS